MLNDLTTAILKATSDNKIEIINPNIISDNLGGKVNTDADFQLNIMSEWKSGKYFFNRSVAGGMDDNPLTKDQAISAMCKCLTNLFKNHKLQFISLVIPKRAVEVSGYSIINGVWIRYLIDYLPSTDALWERWDILVKKV
jgi:hypothetical protein